MRRADRLFAIVQALRGGRLRTAEALAARLEVSARTVYRDLADLQARGVPIDGERGVGYVLRDGYFLPPLSLSKLELEALHWGVAFVCAHGDEALADASRELKVKLESALTTNAINPSGAAFGGRLNKAQRAMLRIAREATNERMKLSLGYFDEKGAGTQRIVRPLELEHWGAVWTLTAWCELREDFRVFRIDRLRACQIQAESFRPERGKRIEDYLATLSRKKAGHDAAPA